MVVLGLTGGIGSGKSTVAAQLVARGARLIDADAIVRSLQAPGEPVFEAMVARFGSGIVGSDGALDRKAVADIVFNDADALADLNSIVHPAVGEEVGRQLAEALSGDDEVVILDIPLLVEAASRPEPPGGLDATRRPPDVAGVIVVDTDPELAVRRLVEHRGFSEDDARARISNQATREERLARADCVVDNNGDLEDLVSEVDRCWAWIEGLAQLS